MNAEEANVLVPLDEQLMVLEECGIKPASWLQEPELTSLCAARNCEEHPYRELLCVLGSSDPSGRRYSNEVWCLLEEELSTPESYIVLALKLKELAGPDLPLQDIHVEVEPHPVLSFDLGPRTYRLEPTGTFDETVVAFIAELLDGRSTGRRFAGVKLESMHWILVCVTDGQLGRLREKTHLDWRPLAQAMR